MGIEVGDETVVISRKLYVELMHDQNMLRALENAGVDNWEGYDEALSMYEEDSQYV